ncbi:FAD-dependent monooxygenase family protein [Kitasatospora mediocidica]|uniref:hypothetical protein n=1 Tax=Kitasatospora mediocidica TaxID=58352 RepID=UPI0005624422|nr:hypothetical protein [Kitasatospora mediocidica]
MTIIPDGLVVVGDALCSVSPVNAQGLTVAALEARTVHDTLAAGRRDVAADYFARATRILTAPWGMADEPGQPANRTQKVQGAAMSRLMAALRPDLPTRQRRYPSARPVMNGRCPWPGTVGGRASTIAMASPQDLTPSMRPGPHTRERSSCRT